MSHTYRGISIPTLDLCIAFRTITESARRVSWNGLRDSMNDSRGNPNYPRAMVSNLSLANLPLYPVLPLAHHHFKLFCMFRRVLSRAEDPDHTALTRHSDVYVLGVLLPTHTSFSFLNLAYTMIVLSNLTPILSRSSWEQPFTRLISWDSSGSWDVVRILRHWNQGSNSSG